MDPDEDDDLLGDSDKEPEGSDREMEDAEASDPQNPQNNAPASDKSLVPPQNMPPQKQAALVEEAVDVACSQLIEEISYQVMLEEDEDVVRKVTHVTDPNNVFPSSVSLVLTEDAEVGGSTSPNAPLLELECGVTTPILEEPLLVHPSPTLDPPTEGLSSTATDERVGEVGVGVATATEPLCLLSNSTVTPLEVLGACWVF